MNHFPDSVPRSWQMNLLNLEGSEFKVQVFGKSRIKALKMGGLLAEQRQHCASIFHSDEYKPRNAKNKTVRSLIGKVLCTTPVV